MKLAPKSLDAFLARPDAECRAALCYGPDNGLVRERAGRIKSSILAESNDPFALVELEEAALLADPARLADELSAISLLGGKRLIMILGASDKLAKLLKESEIYFHSDAFVMVISDELTARSSLRSWFESAPQAAAIACYRDEARDIGAVIRKSFAEAGVIAEQDAVEYLVQQLGNDRYVTHQELQKIITYAGAEKHISLTDVQALVGYNRDMNLDELVNALADKNLAQLEKLLQLQRLDGTSPVTYLRALMRYFNRLYYIKSRMAEGHSADQVIAGLTPKVFYKQLPIITRHAQTWSIDNLARALRLLVAAELACKTSNLPVLPASGRRLLQVAQLR